MWWLVFYVLAGTGALGVGLVVFAFAWAMWTEEDDRVWRLDDRAAQRRRGER